MKRRRLLLIGSSAAILATSGCLAGCAALSSGPSMEAGEAIKKLDATLDDTFAAVHPPLKWLHEPISMSEHRDLLNRGNGEATLDRDGYVQTKVSKSKIALLAKLVENHWKNRGYEFESGNRKDLSFRYRTPEDVSIRFEVNADSDVLIGATIADTKYPGPNFSDDGDFPNGLGHTPPDVRDPYWSK